MHGIAQNVAFVFLTARNEQTLKLIYNTALILPPGINAFHIIPPIPFNQLKMQL